jgi:hypothetical protein
MAHLEMTKKITLPATFKYVAFLDLLVDAAYQHRLATQAVEAFEMSRHARASVAAAFLTVECLANLLLSILEVPHALRDDLDKLQPLAKIETSLHITGNTSYDRGRREVQKAVEVIKVRNDYVHSKAKKISAALHEPRDAGAEWMIPFDIENDLWEVLGIPKQSMFWSKDVSYGILKVVRDFLKYVLIDVMKADDDKMVDLLLSNFAFGNVVMPAVFDEFKREFALLKLQKIDFSFLVFLDN